MSRFLLSVLFISFALPAGIARADLPPGDVACEGKSVGDACTTTDKVAGTCQYDSKDNFVCEPKPDDTNADDDGCSASTLSRSAPGLALVFGAAAAFAWTRRRTNRTPRASRPRR